MQVHRQARTPRSDPMLIHVEAMLRQVWPTVKVAVAKRMAGEDAGTNVGLLRPATDACAPATAASTARSSGSSPSETGTRARQAVAPVPASAGVEESKGAASGVHRA